MSKYKLLEYNLNKKRNYSDKDGLIDYLKSHRQVGACPGFFKDPYTRESLKNNKVFGDDKFAWTGDIPYLVEKYEVYIDEEFLKHAGIK